MKYLVGRRTHTARFQLHDFYITYLKPTIDTRMVAVMRDREAACPSESPFLELNTGHQMGLSHPVLGWEGRPPPARPVLVRRYDRTGQDRGRG